VKQSDGHREGPPLWGRVWPTLLATAVALTVGAPAAVASWRHARDVVERSGDAVMAPWLALTTDGMILAALVVIWVRRHRGEKPGVGPWAAFWTGLAVSIAANLAMATSTVEGLVVALWPPVCVAIAMELVALVTHRAAGTPVTGTVTPSVTPVTDTVTEAGTDPVTAPIPMGTPVTDTVTLPVPDGHGHGHTVTGTVAPQLRAVTGTLPDTDELEAMTRTQLRELALSRGVTVRGTKADVIARLQEAS
jgi:hypothetical protein